MRVIRLHCENNAKYDSYTHQISEKSVSSASSANIASRSLFIFSGGGRWWGTVVVLDNGVPGAPRVVFEWVPLELGYPRPRPPLPYLGRFQDRAELRGPETGVLLLLLGLDTDVVWMGIGFGVSSARTADGHSSPSILAVSKRSHSTGSSLVTATSSGTISLMLLLLKSQKER